MTVPLRVEERLRRLEARMTVLEQVPARIDRLESRLRDEIRAVEERVTQAVAVVAANLDESRAETRGMFDALASRLAAIENKLS